MGLSSKLITPVFYYLDVFMNNIDFVIFEKSGKYLEVSIFTHLTTELTLQYVEDKI